MMAAVFPLSDGTLAYEIIGSSRGAAPPGTGKCHRVTLAPSHYLFRSFSLYRPMPASPSPQPRALVFDLDGTLVDSVPDLAKALNRVLAMRGRRSEAPTSELQSLMRISYAVFCLKKKKT